MLKADLHIHSLHSGHAYGTIYDIMKEASSKKMKLIAITDHGPSMKGGAPDFHFYMGSRAPQEYDGVKVLWGCEANIIDKDGNLDVDSGIINRLGFLMAGMHHGTEYEDLGFEKNTEAILNCFKKYPIHVFPHPATFFYEYDIERVCQEACDRDILLEINISALNRLDQNHHFENLDAVKKMIEVVKKNGKKLIIGTDAHFLHEIGDDSLLKKYTSELGLSDDMIVNNDIDELERFIASKDMRNFK